MTAIRILRDVEVPLRDGTRTVAEVWLPDDGQPHPALLVRTPYMKEFRVPMTTTNPRVATARGYAVVVQDTRGKGGSEGEFEPYVTEEQDGYDTVEWVAAQEWCSGDVVMTGTSGDGMTQWLAAVGAPPSLRGIAPVLSTDSYGEGWSYTSGVLEHGFLTTWSATELAPLPDKLPFIDDAVHAYEDFEAAAAVAPWLREWFANGPDSDYWRARSVAHRREEIQVPILATGGWYDIFLAGTLAGFRRSSDERDRLIVGPWGHDGGVLFHHVGEGNVGIGGFGGAAGFADWMLDFYDAVIAGKEPPLPKVRAYVLGAKQWVDLPSWPPPDARAETIALEPGAIAVDPADPVPTRLGRGLLVHVPGFGYGVADQRPLLERGDVHVAARTTLSEDTLLAGTVTAHLKTEAEGAEERLWAATLCVEQPDGALHNLVDGVAAASGDATQVDVSLGDTFAALPAGSTIVLLIAGSSFPRWPRPQTAGEQRVLAGSTLELTVAPAGLM